MNNSEYEDFATRRISTLMNIFGHLKGIVSHKNTQYYKLYLYFNLSVYISRDFGLPLSIEMHGWPFCFRAIPTTDVISVLLRYASYIYILYYNYIYNMII